MSAEKLGHGRVADLQPEFSQPRHAVLRGVAGDQGGVDRADRGADHPVRFNAGFLERLIDAGLIGAERAAALEHQNDLAELGLVHQRFWRRFGGLHR